MPSHGEFGCGWTRGQWGCPDMGRGFWPLSAAMDPCPALPSLGGHWGGSAHLGPQGQFAGLREDGNPGTQVSWRLPGSLGIDSESGPQASQGCGSRQVCRVGARDGAGSSSAVRLGFQAARGPKGRIGKEELKTWWLKYSVSLGVGWGCPGPSPGDPSPLEGQLKGAAGIWQMASV